MGISIDLYKYDYTKLVADLMCIDGIDNNKTLEMILSECGEICGNTYLLLNNEYYDEGNPYYSVAGLIDSVFGIEDSFDVIMKNHKPAKDYVNVNDIAEKLGIELQDE